MTSSIVDVVLLAALLVASFRMAAIHRELKRLRDYHAEYRLVFDQTSVALADARSAVSTLTRDGSMISEVLGARIDQAQALIGRFETLVLLAFRPAVHEAAGSVPATVLDAPTMIPISMPAFGHPTGGDERGGTRGLVWSTDVEEGRADGA